MLSTLLCCLSKSPCLTGNFKQLFRVTYTFKKSILYSTVCYVETSQPRRVPAFVNSFNESSSTDQGSMQRDKNRTAAVTFIGPGLPPLPVPLVEKI